MNAIITGGTKGIGYAIAKLLLSKGINVSICARSVSDVNKVIKEFSSQYPEARIIGKPTDMSKKEAIDDFVAFTFQHFEGVDVLINNAGVFIPGEILKEEEGALETMVETNLYSAYHLTRSVVPKMIDHGSGHVFNMCSVASLIAYPNGGSYSISKFALLGFSKVLREELKSKNVKVTSIMPGATWSASWEGVDLPKERLMQADDIANVVWSAMTMSPSAVVEDIVIRPQLGDL